MSFNCRLYMAEILPIPRKIYPINQSYSIWVKFICSLILSVCSKHQGEGPLRKQRRYWSWNLCQIMSEDESLVIFSAKSCMWFHYDWCSTCKNVIIINKLKKGRVFGKKNWRKHFQTMRTIIASYSRVCFIRS